MNRKIIQICAVPGFRGSLEMVVALCDDGSVWCHPDGMEWRRLADIPQPEPRAANWVEKEVTRIMNDKTLSDLADEADF